MRFIKKFSASFPAALIDKIFLVLMFLPVLMVAIQWIALLVTFPNLKAQVPIFYSLPWGENQLADKNLLVLIPSLATISTLITIFFMFREYKRANFPIVKFNSFFSVLTNLLIAGYFLRILQMSSLSTIQFPIWTRLIALPLFSAFVTTVLLTPVVIKIAKRYGFMDDPLRHKHPAMLLTKPVPRAGGLAFLLGISIPGIVLLPITQSQRLIGIFIAAIITVFMNLKDDKSDMSPYTRLGLQAIAVLVVAMSGIILIYIPNPFGSAIKLDDYRFAIDFLGENRNIHYISVFAASIWMWTMMNFMSWANGTDGVYAGLVTISSLAIAIIMLLHSLPDDPNIAPFIKLAALTAGAGLGMAIFTWPPNKLMWGFGATTPALIIAAISILGSTKVAATLLILIIPFLDGIWAIIRRVSRGQMPFWGDREHFHHKLLDGLGWSKQKIAVFYWTITAILGLISLTTSGKTRALSIISAGLMVVILISILNLLPRNIANKVK